MRKTLLSGLPDTDVLRKKPPNKCACGCGQVVTKGNMRYATRDCRNKVEGRGRYKTLREDLAGQR